MDPSKPTVQEIRTFEGEEPPCGNIGNLGNIYFATVWLHPLLNHDQVSNRVQYGLVRFEI